MVSICTFLFAFWNVIYLDFAMFNYNLSILSHSFILKSLLFIKDSKLSFECSEATRSCLPEEVSFQIRSAE